ncbi:hypothetical protein HPB48_009945 [Haemaphysalis longicornis]|uniref:Uncharacterized protein n=1 Tax=Haemaphysalis longicornis TaxID=44386 RepID=A0A9J6GUN7_HAELO|nr:hypothetical protein HPB48_009945 [Haemaphysalis longicornis]
MLTAFKSSVLPILCGFVIQVLGISVIVVFSDLGVGLVSVLTDIIWKTTVDWYGGHLGCKLVKFAQVRYGDEMLHDRSLLLK